MKNTIKQYKEEYILFFSIVILYLSITMLFFTNTTIFYDTNNTYNVLLDTDTGVLFNWNTFAMAQDNSKHILFSAIVSLLGYPIYVFSNIATKFGLEYKDVYGLGLITLQILVSATSVTLIYNYIKTLNIKKKTLILLISVMILSFPQIFMSLNIERFIYGQLSIVFFIFLVSKIKNQESYLIDIAAIPLFGITLTNIYLYFLNLIFEFKFNIKKIMKHIGVFILVSYIVLVATKSHNALFAVADVIESDTKFILMIPLIEKIKLILLRLMYPIFYFPGYEIVNGTMMKQNGDVNSLFLILVMIVTVMCIVGFIRNYKDKIAQLCVSSIAVNLILHGLIGYNLSSANIMVIHFSFAIIILLAFFAKSLDKKQTKLFNILLLIVLITVVISNINGFIEILKLGVSIYPK